MLFQSAASRHMLEDTNVCQEPQRALHARRAFRESPPRASSLSRRPALPTETRDVSLVGVELVAEKRRTAVGKGEGRPKVVRPPHRNDPRCSPPENRRS